MSIDNVCIHAMDKTFVWSLIDVNVLSGGNGSGKSSLLSAIATTYKNHVRYIGSDNYGRYLSGDIDEINNKLSSLEDEFYGLTREEKCLFFDIVDQFLSMNGKHIDRDYKNIYLWNKDYLFDMYASSSGEKRLFLILLTAFLQKEGTLIIDEPELSLNCNWQELLIDSIKKLNGNLQIIVATNSPSIIINGWQDKVVDIESIKQ